MTNNTSTSNENSNMPVIILTGLGCGAAGLILSGVVGLVLGWVVGVGLFALLAIGLSGLPNPEDWSEIIIIGSMIGIPLGVITAIICGLGGAVLGAIGGPLVLRRYRSGENPVMLKVKSIIGFFDKS